MDLKSYKGHTLLYLIDYFTRFAASSVIPNKKPETIIQSIFKIWMTTVTNFPTWISWICVKLLGLLLKQLQQNPHGAMV